MVVVSPTLVRQKIKKHPILERAFTLLEESVEVQSYLTMANVTAVQRLMYNDHGPVHSRIVAGSALEIIDILLERGYTSSIVKDGVGDEIDSRLVAMMGAYLHDIGNSVHRRLHHITGVALASRFLPRILKKVYRDDAKPYKLTPEILHCILAHDENEKALSLEAGVSKIADGTDMAEGRARIPYKHGKSDIHALSAMAIKRVEILHGGNGARPVKIVVDMGNEAGIFQIEQVLGLKIQTSGIANAFEVEALKNGLHFKTITFG
ncbi:MAG: HD domain-containing protein [Aigarchaeota archaeon]|nr:HD domain-containing protein [Aigarchaeota archaeon]MCX8192391.1 HD domain-containing protein [Nitrososphaeria archaeon]MDW7986491.1 HD domain-containing protein [Nitrososphaerota archaeon]